MRWDFETVVTRVFYPPSPEITQDWEAIWKVKDECKRRCHETEMHNNIHVFINTGLGTIKFNGVTQF